MILHRKSLDKMKERLKELTKRSNGWGNEYRITKINQFIVGWVNYFKLAIMKKNLQLIDKWLRRRIRAIYWKQWKKVRTRYKMIGKYNLPEWLIHNYSNCRKGVWRSAKMLNRVLTNKEIDKLGYKSLFAYYLQVSVN